MPHKSACYIVSCKYAPGLLKEFLLLGRNIQRHGWHVKYLLSSEYGWMLEGLDIDVAFVSSSKSVSQILLDIMRYPFAMKKVCTESFQSAKPAFICFYNTHPLNFAIARLANRFSLDGIRAVFLHEPAKPDKARYGWKGSLFFRITELIQKISIISSTDVILPSSLAMRLFSKYFPRYHGKSHYAPILIPDCPGQSVGKRRYFSIVGRFNFSKRLDTFIDAANYAAQNGLNFHFQIVTSSPIDKSIKQLTPQANEKVRIINRNNISDKDISKAIAESFAVLCLHSMVTQSGVVPVAFMNSTPVIVPDEPGFTQFVRHKSNGWVLPEGFSNRDIVEAMESVRQNFDSLHAGARHSYLDLFAENNWQKHYTWLIDSLMKI